MQFALLPMNLLGEGNSADGMNTGTRSTKSTKGVECGGPNALDSLMGIPPTTHRAGGMMILDTHIALYLGVELLAGPMIMIEFDDLLRGHLIQIAPIGFDLDLWN